MRVCVCACTPWDVTSRGVSAEARDGVCSSIAATAQQQSRAVGGVGAMGVATHARAISPQAPATWQQGPASTPPSPPDTTHCRPGPGPGGRCGWQRLLRCWRQRCALQRRRRQPGRRCRRRQRRASSRPSRRGSQRLAITHTSVVRRRRSPRATQGGHTAANATSGRRRHRCRRRARRCWEWG